MASALSKLVSEPLTHFAAIGLALFALDLALREPAEDPNLIRIDGPVAAELAGMFLEGRKRKPTEAELDEIVDLHIANEVLYREARALELDHGDQMMRERLIQRMRLMMYSGITIEEPTDDVLRPWFEERADRYAAPPTVSFHVIGLDTDDDAVANEEAVRANAADAAGESPARAGEPLVRLTERPRPQLVKLFDEAFVEAVEAAPKDEWTPIASPRGWQVVKFLGADEGFIPTFEQARTAARNDWRDERKHIEARAVLDSVLKRYPVERAPYDPALLSVDEAQIAEAKVDIANKSAADNSGEETGGAAR